LPGETRVRLVPNQGHLIDLKIVEDALLSYFRAFLKRSPLPQVKWSVTHPGAICHVMTDKQPQTVKLWEAENTQSRDFRLAAQIKYADKNLAGTCREGFYQYPVLVSAPPQGWKAHFIEMTFQERQGDPLILTTPAYVLAANE
jgi:PhoPQ-activated pathogenicity-related protein